MLKMINNLCGIYSRSNNMFFAIIRKHPVRVPVFMMRFIHGILYI